MQREKEIKSLQQWSLVLPYQPGSAQFHGQQHTLIPVSVLSTKPSNKQFSLLPRQSFLDIPGIKVIFFLSYRTVTSAKQLHPKVHRKRETTFSYHLSKTGNAALHLCLQTSKLEMLKA